MKPRRTYTSDLVLHLPGGNEDNDLWAERCADEDGDVVISSVWVPTREERQAIADGANVELLVWGAQPPVAMRTNTTPLGKPPTGVES